MTMSVMPQVAAAYASLYSQLCAESLGRRPNGGRVNISGDSRSDRLIGIVRNAEKLGVSPEKFVRGVVAEMKARNMHPIHVFTVGQDFGVDLFSAYVERVSRAEYAQENTAVHNARRDFQIEVINELNGFRQIMERHVSRLYRGNFDDAWPRFLGSSASWRLFDVLDSHGVLPACFKLLWDPWAISGRPLPDVPERYADGVANNQAQELCRTLFPWT